MIIENEAQVKNDENFGQVDVSLSSAAVLPRVVSDVIGHWCRIVNASCTNKC